MDLAQHFRTIWQRRVPVVLIALAVGVAVFAWRSTQSPTYEAETRVGVVPSQTALGARPTGDDAVFIAQAYADRATTIPVLTDAGNRSGLGLDADEVANRVMVDATSSAAIVTVTATGTSAADAATLADSVAVALVTAVKAEQVAASEAVLGPLRAELAAVEAALAPLPLDSPARPQLTARHSALVDATVARQLQAVDRVEVVAPAPTDTDAVAPRPLRDALLAFLIALVLAAEGAVLLSLLSDRFSARDLRNEVAAATGLPVLALVPRGGSDAGQEAFRELRTNLAFMSPPGEAPRAVAVVGAAGGVGRTHTAIELARAAAAGSQPVLLVDSDLRQPEIHECFGLARTPGLADVLLGAPLTLAMRDAGARDPWLNVVAAGQPLADPQAALAQHLRERVLIPARQVAELTVLDTPPTATFADAVAVAAQCDATIVVIDAGAADRRALLDLIGRLRQVGVEPLGIVVNRVTAEKAAGDRSSLSDSSTCHWPAPVMADAEPRRVPTRIGQGWRGANGQPEADDR